MELHVAEQLVISLMREHGLGNLGWKFKFDNAYSRLGICRYSRRVIGLSRPFILANEESEVRDTILHEIAHALTPGADHGLAWRLKAQEIGARPERCASADVKQVPADWQGECQDCHIKINRQRRPSTRMLESGYHNPCRRKLNKGRLTWYHRGAEISTSVLLTDFPKSGILSS